MEANRMLTPCSITRPKSWWSVATRCNRWIEAYASFAKLLFQGSDGQEAQPSAHDRQLSRQYSRWQQCRCLLSPCSAAAWAKRHSSSGIQALQHWRRRSKSMLRVLDL
eukprot:365377-Chlamydomonas_euryale.AAC.41